MNIISKIADSFKFPAVRIAATVLIIAIAGILCYQIGYDVGKAVGYLVRQRITVIFMTYIVADFEKTVHV